MNEPEFQPERCTISHQSIYDRGVADTEKRYKALVEVGGDLQTYLDEFAGCLPQAAAGRFGQREPVALRDRLRLALAEAP